MSTTTKEHPMLFSGPMVRAILDRRKTQTRRVIKPQPDPDTALDIGMFCPSIVLRDGTLEAGEKVFGVHSRDGDYGAKCPWRVGDRIWVRETWASDTKHVVAYKAGAECGAWFGNGAGGRIWMHHGYVLESPDYRLIPSEKPRKTFGLGHYGGKWRPSIHMPRWASRITLEVTGVRVERLRDISEEDAKAEGVEPYRCPQADALMNAVGSKMQPIPYTSGFANLWNSIAKPGETWDANPWVWVIEFRLEAK